MNQERWRAVLGYEGVYEVSDQGRVRSLARCDSRGRRVKPRIMSQITQQSGHMCVKLSRDGSYRSAKVHQLVLEAFVGPRPDGCESLHYDDNPANNNIVNLRWGTRSENLRDRVRNGLHVFANKTHCPQGHPYDDTNTYHKRDGGRMCRECLRIRSREYKARKKAA